MKLVRVYQPEGPRYGILEDDVVHLTSGQSTSVEHRTGESLALSEAKLLVPTEPSKILGVGRNYADHIAEMGFDVPDRPSLFMKPPSALLAAGGDVVLPEVSTRVEHEAELAVIIGRRARSIEPETAPSHILGYACADDVSARDLQQTDDSVIRGKGFDTFCPLGPWIETELDIRNGVGVRCTVNGEVRQNGNTRHLLFDVPYLVSYLSQFTTLLPGDVILTGSPGGTGSLRPGDQVEIEVDGVGTLRHGVR